MTGWRKNVIITVVVAMCVCLLTGMLLVTMKGYAYEDRCDKACGIIEHMVLGHGTDRRCYCATKDEGYRRMKIEEKD